MTDPSRLPSTPASPLVGLGVPGLPAGVDQVAPGLVYAVVVESQAIRLPLLAQSIESAVRAGRRAVLVTPADPAGWVRKVELAGIRLEPFLRDDRLQILQIADGVARRMLRGGIRRLTDELGQAAGEGGALIALDHADPLFVLNDPQLSGEAGAALQAWARERGHTVLASFVPDAHSPRDYVVLRALGNDFGGFAVVRADAAGVAMEIRHWFGRGGAQPRAWYRMDARDGGRLSARPIDAPALAGDADADEPVLAMRAAGLPQAAGAAKPRVVESLLDVVDAARGLQAGIVVLALASRGELESVAKAVALLRGFGRARIKVVVREVGHRCRLADTVALLRLGASAVCPASADGATLRALVDTLRGSGYHRPVIADVETAFRSSRGDFSGTPLLPRAFAAHARRLLQPGPFAMPNLLVQLPAGADQLAALSRRIVARRIRDVMVTALDGRVWMFVSGCARPQLPIVLERLFGARAVAFERAVQCHAEPDAILECLARFGVEADDAPPPVVAREVAADAIA